MATSFISRVGSRGMCVAVLAGAMVASPALAATRTWTGSVDQIFGTVGNWNTAVPDASDTALWNGASTSNLSISLATARAVKGLQLTSPAGNVTLSGSTLTLGSGGIDMSAATRNLTITSNLALSGGQVWDIASGQTLTLSTGTFTRNSGSTVRVQGAGTVASTMTGFTNNGSGILGGWATIGTVGSASYATLSGGVVVPYTGATATSGPPSGGAAPGINYDFTFSPAGATWTMGINRVISTMRFLNGGTVGQNSGAQMATTGVLNAAGSDAVTMRVFVVPQAAAGEVVINSGLGGFVMGKAPNVAGTYTIAGSGTVNYDGSNVTTSVGASTFQVAGGALRLSGATNFNTFTGMTVNGPNASLQYTSTVASTTPITLTAGTLDGTGSVGAVSVGDGTGGIVSNGVGADIALTMASLSFAGDAAINVRKPSDLTSPGVIVTGGLTTTPANGPITVNVLSGPTWANGSTYNLVGYGSLAGSAAGSFTLGTVGGLSPRQFATLADTGTGAGYLTITVAGDTPYWTGGSNSNWNTTQTGNWKLQGAGTNTVFLTNDQVIFNDNATGSTSVDINAANVAVSGMTFDNATKNYTISSSGGFGIVDGSGAASLTKSGAGSLTLTTANAYSGGTTINAGTINIATDTAIGSGRLTLAGGALDNTSGSAMTYATAMPQTWSGNFTFAGTVDTTHDISFGTPSAAGLGLVTLGGTGSVRTVGIPEGTFTVGAISGTNGTGYGLTKTGNGTLTLNPAVISRIGGPLVIESGVVNIGQNDFYAGGLSGSGTLANGSDTTRWFFVNSGTDPSATSTFSGSIMNSTNGATAGALGLVKQGAGTLVLAGANSYTDPTTLQSGTIVMANTEALANSARVNMSTNTGLVLKTDGGELATRIGFGSGSVVNLVSDRATPGEGVDHPLSVLAGSGLGWGTINITAGSNVTSGTASVSFDYLGFGAGSVGTTLLNPVGTRVTLGDVTKFNNNVSQVLGLGGTTTGNVVNGVISDGVVVAPNNVGVSKSDVGEWTLLGNNLYTGATTVSGGTLFVGDGGYSGSLGTGNLVNNATVVFNRADYVTYAGAISGTGATVQRGVGQLTLTGNSDTYTGSVVVEAGTLAVGDGALSGSLGSAALVNNGAVTFSRYDSSAYGGVISGTGSLSQTGYGTLTLTGTSPSYAGGMSVTSGTLSVTGQAPLASVSVNGGILNGTGAVGAVSVAFGNTIANGDGGTGDLAMSALSFDGAATANLAIASGSAGITVSGALTTNPTLGTVTINASSPLWANGTNNLISFGSFGGSLSNFTLGTITGLSSRQSGGSLILSGNNLALSVSGDSLVWSGRNGGTWTTTATGSPVTNPNWALKTSHAPANFWATDVVEFNDTVNVSGTVSAPTTTTVSIQGGSVSPTIATFNNATLDYTLASSDGSGIAAGAVVKNGAGKLTINTTNSYAGGTTINAGTVDANASGALGAGAVNMAGGVLNANGTGVVSGGGAVTIAGGTVNAAGSGSLDPSTLTLAGGRLNLTTSTALSSGTLSITGGTLANTSGANLTLANVVAQRWNGSFATGTGSINFNGATATVAGTSSIAMGGGTLTLGDVANVSSSLTLTGSGAVVVSANPSRVAVDGGRASLTVNGPNYTVPGEFGVGAATVGGAIGGSGSLAVASGTVNVGGVLRVSRGFNAASTVTGTVSLTGGTLNVGDDAQIGYAGAGNTATVTMSGGVMNVGTNGQRALVLHQYDTTPGVMNLSGGEVKLLNNTFLRMHNGNGNASATLNQTGGSITFYSDAGSTVGGSGNLDLQTVSGATNVSVYNLAGGTLTTPSIISSQTNGTRTFNFNGGTLRAAAGTANFMNLGGGAAAAYVQTGGAVVDTNGYNVTIAQSLLSGTAGSGGLRKVGAGTLTLTGASTYTGTTAIEAGTLTANGTLASNVTVASGAIFSGTGSSSGSLAFAAGSTLQPTTTQAFTSNGVSFGGPTTLQFNGAVTTGSTYNVVFYGAGGVTGLSNLTTGYRATILDDAANSKITFTAGSVESLVWQGGNGTWQTGGSTPQWLGSDGLFYNGDTTSFVTGTGAASVTLSAASGALLPAAVNVNSDTDFTFGGAGAIGGTATVTKAGSGALTMATDNSYSGVTTLTAGTLNVNAATALGTGTIAISGGALGNTSGSAVALTTGNAQVWSGNLAFTGPNDLTMGTGAVALEGGDRTATVSAGTLTVGRVTGTTGGFTKAGAGTLTINPIGGASSVTGTLTVAAGTLNIGSQDFTATGLAGSGTIANGSTTTRWLVVNSTDSGTFSGVLANGTSTGLLGLSKQGTGTLTLAGVNTYGDYTTVGNGVLTFSGSGSALSSSRYVIANGDGVLHVNGTGRINSNLIDIQSGGANPSTSTNRLEVSGGASLDNAITLAPKNNAQATILNTSGSNALTGVITIVTGGSSSRIESTAGLLTIGGTVSTTATSNRNLVLAGAGNGRVTGAILDNVSNVAGTISVSKEGTGTWTLAGQSLNTGATTVYAGTLLANTTLTAGPITVNAGGALGGSGTVGTVTMAAGATLTPGDGVGTLTDTQSLTLVAGGRYAWQLANATGTAGSVSGWDLLNVDGTLDVAATSADPFSIDLWTLSSTSPVTNGQAANFNASTDYTWKIASAAGGITNFSADAFTVITSATNGTGGFANAFGGGTFSVAQSGNDLNLVFTHGSAPTVITINVASGTQTQTAAGYPSLSGTLPLEKTGAGTLVLDQINTISGSTTIQGGVLQLANLQALQSSAIFPVAGGTLTLAPYQVAVVGGLDPNAGGLTDVGSGLVTVSSGLSAANMVTAIVAGMGDGSWNGTTGITSSVAAADSALGVSRSVGWLDNGDGTVTFAYAAPGDTNLDWSIDLLDIGTYLAAGKYDTGEPSSWSEGDYTYDGLVDITDVALYLGTGLFDMGPYNPPAGVSGGVASVPEPSAFGMLAAAVLCGIGTTRLRRR